MTVTDFDFIPDGVSRTAIELATRLHADYGIELRLRNNRLWVQPAKAYQQLPEEDRALIRKHRAELKLIVEDTMVWLPRPLAPSPDGVEAEPPAPKKKEEPEPEVWAYHHRVTRHDVHEALEALGDEALADYRAGRITKTKAYAIARNRIRQVLQMGGQSAGWQDRLRIG